MKSPAKDSAQGIVRHSCESYSEFLSTGNPMAILRHSLRTLKGFVEMTAHGQTVDIGHFAPADEREALNRDALTREVRSGLIARPRSLSPWMFYDAQKRRVWDQRSMERRPRLVHHHARVPPKCI
jgi:hypothetical protein